MRAYWKIRAVSFSHSVGVGGEPKLADVEKKRIELRSHVAEEFAFMGHLRKVVDGGEELTFLGCVWDVPANAPAAEEEFFGSFRDLRPVDGDGGGRGRVRTTVQSSDCPSFRGRSRRQRKRP